MEVATIILLISLSAFFIMLAVYVGCLCCSRLFSEVAKPIDGETIDRILKTIEYTVEKLNDGRSKSRQAGDQSRGFASPIEPQKSRSGSKVPAVGELPPDVIAPSLKGMQKSSGFGANKSKKASDS